jgi:hypothetical protein
VKTNIKDRVASLKELVYGEIDVIKTVVNDVFRVAKGMETELPKRVNFPGVRHGLLDEPMAFGIATSDQVSKFVQRQIEITRRWF